MTLERVTITGADDSTDVREMNGISRNFPFVEWGILVGSTTGPRFPGNRWMNELANAWSGDETDSLKMLLHLCGSILRCYATSNVKVIADLYGQGLLMFDRVQLNWHGQKYPSSATSPAHSVARSYTALERHFGWSPELIFQLDKVNDWMLREPFVHDKVARRAGLFDLSHGAGELPESWPKAWDGYRCGYAGGLGPDNVADELQRIQHAAGTAPFWIDMETNVRTGEVLDLDKVRSVLEQVAPYVACEQGAA